MSYNLLPNVFCATVCVMHLCSIVSLTLFQSIGVLPPRLINQGPPRLLSAVVTIDGKRTQKQCEEGEFDIRVSVCLIQSEPFVAGLTNKNVNITTYPCVARGWPLGKLI